MPSAAGPALTLAAVGAVAVGVATANVVLTADPAPPAVEQATGALALGSPLPAPAAPPAPDAPQGSAGYTGWSADRAVSVDIRVENGSAKAYVCDGAAVESWTTGPVAQDGPTVLTAGDGSRVEYTVRDGAASGTASVGGTTWEFTAPRAPAAAEPAAPPAGDTGSVGDTGSGGDAGADGDAGSGGYGGGY